jgi:hypothetical protein
MNQIPETRYLRLTGTPYQIGLILGEKLRSQLGADIDHYITQGPLRFQKDLDRATIQKGAMAWFGSLPQRYQTELEGMADGSGVPLETIAEWGFVDAGGQNACSGFILKQDDSIWVGRNNDLWVPDLWGYAIRRQVSGRLGYISFGMRGEIFAATGLNQAGLWLHYNWLPVFDKPEGTAWTPFVLLTEMLETCKDPDEVGRMLKNTTRTGGMLVFAIEGRKGTCAVFECSCCQVARQDCEGPFLAATNHYQHLPTPELPEAYAPDSVKRLLRLESRLQSLSQQDQLLPESLISVLADPQIEQHEDGYGTVYANLCNPMDHQLWFTFGGYPAASQGNWQKIPWPF